MIVASCFIKLQLHDIHSLKGKRSIVKSLLTRLPREYNVAVAEVAFQDVWQTAGIAIATVGTDAGQLHTVFERALAWIERTRPDITVADYEIEIG